MPLFRPATIAQRRRGGASAPQSHPLGGAVAGASSALATLRLRHALAGGLVANSVANGTVSVTAGATGFAANESAVASGGTWSLFIDSDFTTPWAAQQNVSNAEGWNYNNAPYVVSRQNIGGDTPDGPWVANTAFPAGDTGGGGGDLYHDGSSGNLWQQVYWSMWVWLSANYVCHPIEEKFWYPPIKSSNGSTDLARNIFGLYTPQAAYFPNENQNGPSSSSVVLGLNNQVGGDSQVYQDQAAPRLVKGQWNVVEFYCRINTGSNYDGTWIAWINGTQVVNRDNVRYKASASAGFWRGISLSMVRGGAPSGDAAVPAGGQLRRYSRIRFIGNPNR